MVTNYTLRRVKDTEIKFGGTDYLIMVPENKPIVIFNKGFFILRENNSMSGDLRHPAEHFKHVYHKILGEIKRLQMDELIDARTRLNSLVNTLRIAGVLWLDTDPIAENLNRDNMRYIKETPYAKYYQYYDIINKVDQMSRKIFLEK
jgi:hypothetical protein